ncbi:rCG36350 [Rattus norvegicus]|uniref:RCG36350 n=1 Tax=Rattus norvegicus TaxID=10116 RepID=A6IQ29_RAT|nr:rCG36350 [Rattus norvegicus]
MHSGHSIWGIEDGTDLEDSTSFHGTRRCHDSKAENKQTIR